MKLTVLGCWAPYPRAGGACSGYLLQADGQNILIECGNGVVSNLQKYIDFRSLDAIIISHFHPDHYLDLFCLRHAVAGARRVNSGVEPKTLYMPNAPSEPFNQICRLTDAFSIHTFENLSKAKRNGLEVYQVPMGNLLISFIRTDHPLPAYAMFIEGKGSFFFTSDTKWQDSLPIFAAGADLALCEASVSEEDREYISVGHLTARQAGELAQMAGIDRLMMTHFWPEYNLDQLKTEAEAGFGKPVIVASEGLELNI